jgi:spore cortex formation protein SpoVR/YcgB (stage V sporulation)
MCENPTEEDKKWFPEVVGRDWKDVIVNDIVANYRDESFLRQFLSPKVMRDFRLFAIRSDDQNPSEYEVIDVHNEQGYRAVRKTISEMHDINAKIPNIQIVDVDALDTRKLTLYHYTTKNQLLADDPIEVLKYIEQLWGYPVELFSIDDVGDVAECYDTSKL